MTITAMTIVHRQAAKYMGLAANAVKTRRPPGNRFRAAGVRGPEPSGCEFSAISRCMNGKTRIVVPEFGGRHQSETGSFAFFQEGITLKESKFRHASLKLPVVRGTVASNKRRVFVPGMAGQFHNLTRNLAQPSNQECGVANQCRIGDASQPLVAGKAGSFL